MNVVIKMMDADNTGFRLLTVTEPVDVHVKAYNPPGFQKPVLVVGYGLTALNKTYDVNGNVYIMNEAGDTISKVDYADVSKGMPERVNIVDASRESSLQVSSSPAPVHAFAGAVYDYEENRDHGTILKSWEKHNKEIGAYFDGDFKPVEAITSVMIRQFKVFAKAETIEELRKQGDWPEAKLAMLEANDKVVNPASVKVTMTEDSLTVESKGEIKLTTTGTVTVAGETREYARYEQDVLERDANGQVVFDDKGNSIIKHKKGDVILSDLLSVQSQPSPGYLG